ncbi:hypothetical protein SPRG_00687 [Saprolegnia parasitica CBS 223.65]|uniref:Uncharacterized protein n=1 Tax=Saprolegnia parasitica (strain CBS 223.65) TaxID=695850 RepID=A0A067CV90_SAPPC|nr:hypothetical protein SPRG_00687 [Saprolegnia parasitica CBS 223.65]KDO34624.1 hypothetical protein SPRG_00687 [Saprolegnia parasitica CBS 223.65]|eukprot:XP_012194300.1 hypothetical protein SPRG_00687 [Saprolegnia parasitica CBS 223.65]
MSSPAGAPWLYQSLPSSTRPLQLPASDKPLYLNAASLKSLFQMDSPGFQMAKHPFLQPTADLRRKRLQHVAALTLPRHKTNQADDKSSHVVRKKPSKKRARPTKTRPLIAPPALDERASIDDAQRAAQAAQMGLTLDEFNALEAQFGGQALNQNEMVERYRAVFDEYDTDKSGSISPDELRTLLKAMGEADLDDGEINDIIRQADADNNGSIEFEEFINMMKARKRLLAVAQHVGAMASASKSKLSLVADAGLPPLKVAPQRSKRHLQQFNRFMARPTPSCLQAGAPTDVAALRRELALSEYGLKTLDMKVREDVQWVQANCPVTSLKAQLFCQKWGAEKMNKFFSRILLNFQARAFYKWIDYLTFMAAKLKADKYLKVKAGARLHTLMHAWKHKSLVRAWFAWTQEAIDQARNERNASAIEIQKRARGLLVRVARLHHRQDVGAVAFQRIVRGHLGRCAVRRLRQHRLEVASASLLQKCYRGFAGRRLGRQLFRVQAMNRAAIVIQTAFRTYQQRLFAREVLYVKRQHRAAVILQCAARRKAAYLEIARRRLVRRKAKATRDLQRCVRGWLGRLRVRGIRRRHSAATQIQRLFRGHRARVRVTRLRCEKAAKRLAVKRDRAALRIQAFWRGATGKYAYHLRLRATREQEQRLAATRRASAIRVQSLYRGVRGRRYCNALDAERTLRRRQQLQHRSALQIQRRWRGHTATRDVHLRRQAKAALDKEEHFAAIKIQCLARSKQARNHARKLRRERKRQMLLRQEREEAAVSIQAALRGHWGRQRAAKKKALFEANAQAALAKLVRDAQETAAVRIQCCMRGYLSRERYRVRLREHRIKVAALNAAQERANAAIRIQCFLRKRKAVRMLALRRAEFQKRIAMLASEKAGDEIARLRQEQEVELAQMKLQMLLEKGAIEAEAARLRAEVEQQRLVQLATLKIDEATLASDKLAAMLEPSHTSAALQDARELEAKREALDRERQQLASMEEKRRRAADEDAKQRDEDARLRVSQNLLQLDTAKSLELARKQDEQLQAAKALTAEAANRVAKERAALQIQAFVRASLSRKRLKRIQEDQKRQLEAIKDVQERALLKARLEKEEVKRRLVEALEDEARVREQEERELALVLEQKKIREQQRVAERKAKDVAARRIQAAGKGYIARRQVQSMQAKIEAERKRREAQAAKEAAAEEAAAKAKADAVATSTSDDEWVEYWDENAQASYYFNIRTQEASWTKPGYTNPADVAAQLLSYSNAISTQDYTTENVGGYYSATTNEYGFYDEAGVYHYYDDGAAASGSDGWAQYVDEASGAAYYYNHYTGERYWA